jgi:hypothetical protein
MHPSMSERLAQQWVNGNKEHVYKHLDTFTPEMRLAVAVCIFELLLDLESRDSANSFRLYLVQKAQHEF